MAKEPQIITTDDVGTLEEVLGDSLILAPENAKPVKVYGPEEVREATFVSDGVYEYRD